MFTLHAPCHTASEPSSYPSLVTLQETGNCSYGKECHFAHAAKELVIRTVASKFVEKSVEGDDSKSQFSIDDSVDFAPGKKCAAVQILVLPLIIQLFCRRPLMSVSPQLQPARWIEMTHAISRNQGTPLIAVVAFILLLYYYHSDRSANPKPKGIGHTR